MNTVTTLGVMTAITRPKIAENGSKYVRIDLDGGERQPGGRSFRAFGFRDADYERIRPNVGKSIVVESFDSPGRWRNFEVMNHLWINGLELWRESRHEVA